MAKPKMHNDIQSFLKMSNVITVRETISCFTELFGEVLVEELVHIANRDVKDMLLGGVRGTELGKH